MIGALFRLIFRLLVLVVLVAIFTGIYLVYDGLRDEGEKADCAVVLGNAVKSDGQPGSVVQARLDRAVELFRAGTFPLIIVSGAQELGGADEATGMARYLSTKGVPSSSIIQDHHGVNTAATALDVAAIMHARRLHSVMVISHYYHITRTKIALRHEGVTALEQAHVGVVQKSDAFHVAREIVAIYYYLGRYYLPTAGAEAKIAAEKARIEAEKATEKAKEEIDNLHKS